MPITDTAAEAMKIQRQPTFSAIRPPNTAAKPAPPHDPIDHRLTARWRPAPFQYAFIKARLAGMMQAAESPWQMRPSINKGTASAPDGANPTMSEPTMLRMKPICTIFTRPTRSAPPPMTTMKIPENSAAIDTAMVITLHLDPEIGRHR